VNMFRSVWWMPAVKVIGVTVGLAALVRLAGDTGVSATRQDSATGCPVGLVGLRGSSDPRHVSADRTDAAVAFRHALRFCIWDRGWLAIGESVGRVWARRFTTGWRRLSCLAARGKRSRANPGSALFSPLSALLSHLRPCAFSRYPISR
jgi:hypothetical protein